MPGERPAAGTHSKWTRRASMDPFASSTTASDDAVKENQAPPRSKSHGVVMTPKMVRRRSTNTTSTREAMTVVNVISKPSASGATTTTMTMTMGETRANAITASLLGKRPRGPSPTRGASPHVNTYKMARVATTTEAEEENDEDDVPETQRTLFADESESLDEDGVPRNVLIVNDFVRVAELAFGAVAVGQRKSLLLTMQNPSQVGNARVKYEGYVMSSATREQMPKQTMDSRFKCDMHVCTVPGEGKVTLRITFEPKDQDVNQDLVAMLRFTVNDRFRLQCEVSGSGVAAATKPMSLRERMAMTPNKSKSRKSLDVQQLEQQPDQQTAPRTPTKEHTPATYPIESVLASGIKRRESVALVVSPPRHRKTKKMRLDPDDRDNGSDSAVDIVVGASAATGGFQGSWWEKRKTLSDEEWMQRQEEGFTKWMNFVLVESVGEEAELENTEAIIEHPHRATPRGRKRRARIDFSSLRILAMKRMESMWSRAAMEIYRSDEVTEAAANLKNEIAEGKLVVRRDRPAYADVGLQEELIALLNNYHPVWLCLALETVLGHRVMSQEKCSLRSVMTYCANLAEKVAASKKKGESMKESAATRMPRHLRRVILQHLVHDHQVAKRHRLVKNLKTPVEGGTLRAGKANPKISGRHYFDALMDSFVFKFLMIVLLLDRAAAHRSDKFTRFPCLFRVQPVKSKKASSVEDDSKHLKNTQGIVTEFCRLFLSKEGRIDKHLKQLGYSVSFQQVPLDEVDLEITNLAVDLRDGVRLAKLLETLTAAPGASMMSPYQPLSSFLRVPALSRLQKIHNVEICLHFLQEKCGRDFLESMRTSSGSIKTTGRLSFATLRDKEDAKLVETVAKAVVDGHRERTLALLWKLISVFQLRSLVNVERLIKEIENIKQRMSFRAMEFYESGDSNPASSLPRATCDVNQGLDDDVRELLLEWCRVVCANYFVRVVDFSESFADGRALCYLLHFYHPMLLTKSDIRLTTAEYASSSTRAIHSANDITRALENERRHFTLANDRVKQLGEVPVLLPEQYDSTNPPDEKVIVTFVCYLQSRLMDSSREIHAAARLKRWWRSPRMRLLMRRKKNNAARVIQRFWYTSSVKRLAIRRCRRLLQAARMVASYMCAWFDRSRFLRLRRAVTSIQRAFRRRLVGSSGNIATLVAVVKVQRKWRSHSLRRSVGVSIRKRDVCKRLVRQMSASRIKHLLKLNVEQKHEQREAIRAYQEMLEKQRFESGKKALLKKVHARCARVLLHAIRAFVVYRRQSKAALVIQSAWRMFATRSVYVQELKSAGVLQRAVRRWIERREEEARERFRAMLAEQDRERRSKILRGKVIRRCACSIQRSWRGFVVQKRETAATKLQSVFRATRAKKLLGVLKFEREEASAIILQKHTRRHLAQSRYFTVRKSISRLQAVVRGALSRKNVIDFSQFRRRAVRMQLKLAAWKLREWACKIAQIRLMKRAAATTIQKTWKSWSARNVFLICRRAAVTIQSHVRGRISRERNLNFFVFKWRACARKKRIAMWCIQAWIGRCVNIRRRIFRAAIVIQKNFRMFVKRKQFVVARLAATKIQACMRGKLYRDFVFDFESFKSTRARCSKKMATWKIQGWLSRVIYEQRVKSACALCIQTNVRGYLARREFVTMRASAVKIQKVVRGIQSRQHVHNHGMFRKCTRRATALCAAWKIQLWVARRLRHHSARRSALIKARWTQLSFGLLRSRLAAADTISKSWTSYKLRLAIQARVEWKATRAAAASYAQQWWRGLQLQRSARQQLVDLRIQHAKRVEQERAECAAARVQSAWRRKVCHEHAKRGRKGLIRMREIYATARIGNCILQRLVRTKREKRGYAGAVCRVQSWWRGMLVRLHEKRQAVTEQRKKLATMTLVAADQPTLDQVQAGTYTPDPSKPLTLSTRLELALHMLLHGKRLQEMLFASHTIEMCTRYSRECASKCVQLKISNTIFAAIRGLNRSRPHVELLHQLLLVLVNLTTYQESKNKATGGIQGNDQTVVDQDDLRAVDALVDLLHVHRDMHVIFVLASRVLKHYLLALKPHTSTWKEVFNQWSETHRRLRGLHELLNKKMQVAAWTARLPGTPSKSAANAAPPNANNPNANVMAKIIPKTAVSVVAQLLKVIE